MELILAAGDCNAEDEIICVPERVNDLFEHGYMAPRMIGTSIWAYTISGSLGAAAMPLMPRMPCTMLSKPHWKGRAPTIHAGAR